MSTSPASPPVEQVPAVPNPEPPIDVRLEAGSIVWEGCSSRLIASRNQFAAILAERGWTVGYTSAYRTLTYQEHLYRVAYTPIRSLGRAEAAVLSAERVRHQLSRAVARPGPRDTHVRGVAFDAVVFDERGRARNSRAWRDRRVEQAAHLAGLAMLPARISDSVHFQLV